MSERDFLKRFWISVASGIVLLIISGIGMSFLVNRDAVSRSIRNETAVKELELKKEDKGTAISLYQTLLDGQQKNIISIERNQVFIIERFDKVNDRLDILNHNILDITTRK